MLVLTGLILPPAGLALAAEPGWAVPIAAAVLLFAAVALVDLLLVPLCFARIQVSLPDISRVSKDRELRLPFTFINPEQRQRTLKIAPDLPESFETESTETLVDLPAGTERSRVTVACVPRVRGRYLIDQATIEASSPLGLWQGRRPVNLKCEVRVYPNLFSDRKSLAGMLLSRGVTGVHSQRQLGKGREFEKLREYVPGDGYEEIHWKATARRGRPITKVFQIERTQDIYTVIDASRLSARPAAGAAEDKHGSSEVVLERFINASLVLAQAAEQQGDRFGLLVFSDKVDKFVRAGNGKAHYSAARDALFTIQPQILSPDYSEAATFFRTRVRKRSLVVFLTSLDDPVLAESFSRAADMLRKQHLLLVNMLQPPGIAPAFAAEANSADELYERLGGHLLWSELRQVQKNLHHWGVRFSLVGNERLAPELVSQYLGVKKTQTL